MTRITKLTVSRCMYVLCIFDDCCVKVYWLYIAISHSTSTQTRGINMFHTQTSELVSNILINMFDTSSEAQYKTTLKVASFSEQDPEGVLPVQSTPI